MPKAVGDLKLCSKCKETKSIMDFGKRKNTSDGLSHWCKGCQKTANKDWKERNPDYFREYGRKYMRTYSKTDKYKAYRAQWYRTEKGKAYLSQWRSAHPEVGRAQSARRRVRLETEMSTEDKLISLEYRRAIANDPCFYCLGPGEHDDHWMPLARGGTDHWWNLVRACANCNLRKQATCGLHFMRAKPCDC